MPKKILLVNSDLAANRGDRAIAEGNIALIKTYFPGATITGISQRPERDRKWYGIDFLDMNFQSMNPVDLWRLCRFARTQDVVLWGGGEILKDYTNKAALWYWVSKMNLLRRFNPSIFGMYQGIGPTSSNSSKRLIARLVSKSKLFIVRDKESYEKLASWNADISKIRIASDPAILPKPAAINAPLAKKLKDTYGIDQTFLNDFICIGPRDWFHYKRGGIIPYKYTKRLPKFRKPQPNPTHEQYVSQLRAWIQTLPLGTKTNILFVPMHLEENDTDLCHELRQALPDPDRALVLDKDVLSPAELRSVIGKSKAMIGFRLHATIIAVSAGVPSINIYYVDKGRVFFDQIRQSEYCLPIEQVLEDEFPALLAERYSALMENHDAIQHDIDASATKLRSSVTQTFEEIKEIAG